MLGADALQHVDPKGARQDQDPAEDNCFCLIAMKEVFLGFKTERRRRERVIVRNAANNLKVTGIIGVVGLPAQLLVAQQSNTALAFAKTQTPFARQQLALGIIEKKEAALILILWMERGRSGTRGVDAVSRAAQEGRLALALVPFLLLVMGDPVREMHRKRQAVTSRAAILLMDPGALGLHGAIAVSPVAQGRSSAITPVFTLPTATEDRARDQYRRRIAVLLICPVQLQVHHQLLSGSRLVFPFSFC